MKIKIISFEKIRQESIPRRALFPKNRFFFVEITTIDRRRGDAADSEGGKLQIKSQLN